MEAAPVADLLARAAAGDQQAWQVVVERYAGLLWSVTRAYRLNDADAGDVVQTTWLRLVEQLGRLREPEHVGGWLATTAGRECLRVLNRAGRERPVDADVGLDRADERLEPLDAALLRDERDAQLWTCFSRLSPRCQALLRVLVSDPPLTYQQVGEALGMPIGSIGPTRGRCLDTLRELARADGLSSEPQPR